MYLLVFVLLFHSIGYQKGLQDKMVWCILNLGRCCQMFSKKILLIWIPTNNVWLLIFNFTNTWCFQIFPFLTHTNDLIYIFLSTSEIEHLIMYSLNICILLWIFCAYVLSCPFFKIKSFPLFLLFIRVVKFVHCRCQNFFSFYLLSFAFICYVKMYLFLSFLKFNISVSYCN